MVTVCAYFVFLHEGWGSSHYSGMEQFAWGPQAVEADLENARAEVAEQLRAAQILPATVSSATVLHGGASQALY